MIGAESENGAGTHTKTTCMFKLAQMSVTDQCGSRCISN